MMITSALINNYLTSSFRLKKNDFHLQPVASSQNEMSLFQLHVHVDFFVLNFAN